MNVIGVPEGEEKQNGIKDICKEVFLKHFFRTRGRKQTIDLSTEDTRTHTPMYSIVKLLKTKKKKRIVF